MAGLSGPLPLTGKLADLALAGYPLQADFSTYVDSEAERFGDKISVGDIRYADFNPYETADGFGRWDQGYGLRVVSDYPDPNAAHAMMLESTNFDGSQGVGLPSGEQQFFALPSGNATPVAFLTLHTRDGSAYWLCVAGRKIFRWNISEWIDLGLTLNAPAAQAAITVFNYSLIIGYQGIAPGQVLSGANLAALALSTIVDQNGGALYVWAATSDHGNAYIAGDHLATTLNHLRSSVDGTTFPDASVVAIGRPDSPITGLAPGGGMPTLYITKTDGLGELDNANVYRVLVPFENEIAWNSSQLIAPSGLGWWLGNAGDPQRGPLLLHFNRDSEPWVYTPSTGTAGAAATTIAPWAQPYLRPPNTIGTPTAYAGTARYLWYTITNQQTGRSYLLRRDARTGVTLPYWDLGVNACQAVGVSYMDTLSGGGPRLFVGQGAGVVSTPLPRSGNDPRNDPSCRYAPRTTFLLPGADMGFPDEPKVEFSVRIEADNLVQNTRSIQVQYSLDNESGPFTLLGTADESPVTEILFDSPPTDHRLYIQGIITNLDDTQYVALRGVTLRRSINPKLYRLWEFDAWLPAGDGQQGQLVVNPYQCQQDLWAARQAGVPVTFIDIWGQPWPARILHLEFHGAVRETGAAPQMKAHLRLLQAGGTVATTSLTYTPTGSGTAWPLPTLLAHVGLVRYTLAGAPTVTNGLPVTVYPIVVVTGPFTQVTLTNSTSGLTLGWLGRIGPRETLTFNLNPSKKLVYDSEGTDRSAGIQSGPQWWGLAPGANVLSLSAGEVDALSQLVFTYPTG